MKMATKTIHIMYMDIWFRGYKSNEIRASSNKVSFWILLTFSHIDKIKIEAFREDIIFLDAH